MKSVGKTIPVIVLGSLMLSFGCSATSETRTDGDVSRVEGALTTETYNNGAVISNVEVVVVFWGSNVNPIAVQNMGPFYTAMTNNPYMDSIREYSTPTTPSQLIGRGKVVQVTTITPHNTSATLVDYDPNSVTVSDIQSELVAQVSAGHLPAPNANTYYAIHFPPNMNITANFAGCGVMCQGAVGCHESFQSGGRLFTEQSGMTFRFGLISDCGGQTLSGLGSVASHELMEAVTSPDTQNPRETLKSGWTPDIGDACNGVNASITAPDGSAYTVQKIYSNRAGGCIASAPLNDFNVDNKEDIVWHNGTTGATEAWYMNGAVRVGSGALAPDGNLNDSSGWRLVAMNDFNVDGSTDLLFHNGTTGSTIVYYMNGGSRITISAVDPSLNLPDSTGWQLIGTNDFNGDGRPDFLWHNGVSGATVVWYMNGMSRTGSGTFDPSLNLPDSTGWRIAGTNDFNGDGKPDLLWHHGPSGGSVVWYMNGTSRTGSGTFDSSLILPDSTGWRIAGTNDYNGDGKPDVLWHHPSDGVTQIWYMNGITRSSIATLDASLNLPDSTGWTIVNR